MVRPGHSPAFDPLSNRYSVYSLTDGHCSCAFYSDRRVAHSDQLRNKHRKRGWSESKIERAVASAKEGRDRDWTGLRPDVRHWLAAVAHAAGELLLLMDASSGSAVDPPGAEPPRASVTALRDGSIALPSNQLIRVVP